MSAAVDRNKYSKDVFVDSAKVFDIVDCKLLFLFEWETCMYVW